MYIYIYAFTKGKYNNTNGNRSREKWIDREHAIRIIFPQVNTASYSSVLLQRRQDD